MGFIEWFAAIVGREAGKVIVLFLKEQHETSQKLNAITTEAKELVVELDNAQSETERKAILRKISFFADVSKRLL